jgi:hypothetical protein
MTTNGHGPTEIQIEIEDDEDDALETAVDSSGWFSVQLRYAYLIASADAAYLVEDRVVLVDGEDEEAALGRGFELAAEYEDDFETDEGEAGTIRFEGIVAIKELDDEPAAGTEVWHEFMSPNPPETDAGGEPLPPVRPLEMAFPRGRDD